MSSSELHWYAVTTRSRHEKVVAEQLWQKEIECFLPLREVISKWKDRKKKVQFPLFPGYLFVHVPIQERRVDILKVPSVVRIIEFNGKPVAIVGLQQRLDQYDFRLNVGLLKKGFGLIPPRADQDLIAEGLEVSLGIVQYLFFVINNKKLW